MKKIVPLFMLLSTSFWLKPMHELKKNEGNKTSAVDQQKPNYQQPTKKNNDDGCLFCCSKTNCLNKFK